MTVVGLVLLLSLARLSTSRSDDAYALSVAIVDDRARAPFYIYSGLALVGSIRRHDTRRDILVMMSDATLAVFPMARAMFEANGATIVLVERLFVDELLRDLNNGGWSAAFSKLSAFQLSALGYRKILYVDADGVFVAPADALFALPLGADVELWGMRDTWSCSDSDFNRLMSAAFLFGADHGASPSNVIRASNRFVDCRSRRRCMSLLFPVVSRSRAAHRLTNLLIRRATSNRRFLGSQHLMTELFGTRLRLIDESLATCALRCACRRQRTGVRSLRNVSYVHFTNTVLSEVSLLRVSSRKTKRLRSRRRSLLAIFRIARSCWAVKKLLG